MLKLINGEWKPYQFKTKEEAIEAHRALWDSIAVKCEVYGVDNLYDLVYRKGYDFSKEEILDNELNLINVLCDCPCCAWASQSTVHSTFSNRCNYCPLNWGIDTDECDTPCMNIPTGDGCAEYDQIDPKIVRDLKEKE